MALWQVFPDFEVNCDALGGEKVVPRVRKPMDTGFRGGADLRAVLGVIKTSRNVFVDAAPGAGKTTVLPRALADDTGLLVVHVLPYETLAASTYDYLSRKSSSGFEYVATEKQSWPEKGVAIVSAAVLVAKWLSVGEVIMPSCYLLHDESHECGAASAALRMFGPVAEGVQAYVAMSATRGPSGSRKMEAGGSVDEQAYDPDAFADPWSVEEDGAPWAVSDLTGNILVFEDDRHRAQQLVQAYNYNGMAAYRLHAGMSVRDFRTAMVAVTNPANPYACALIADSTFRSGYTFPVTTIVDSGNVRRVVADGAGRPTMALRTIYACEKVQTSARGGRIDGLRTTYWRPLMELQEAICDLGQTDVEALALICRFLGYRPPPFVEGAKMAKGNVPRNLSGALRAQLPLACLPDDQFVPVQELKKVVSIREEEQVDTVALRKERLNAIQQEKAQDTKHDDGFDMSFAMDMLHGIMEVSVMPEPLQLGNYYCAVGIVTTDAVCAALPQGDVSVRRMLLSDKSHTAHLAWSPYIRSVALNSVINAYNINLLHSRALMGCLSMVRESSGSKNTVGLRTWATNCAEQVANLGANMETGLGLAKILAEGLCDIRSCPNVFDEEETRMRDAFLAEYTAIPNIRMDGEAVEARRVRAWADGALCGMSVRPQGRSYAAIGGKAQKTIEMPWMMRWATGFPDKTVTVRRRARTGSSSSSGGSYTSSYGYLASQNG